MDEFNTTEKRSFTKLRVEADKKDSTFLGIFFAFCVISVWTILMGDFFFGFTLSNIIFLIIMTLYCKGSAGGCEKKAFPIICGVFSFIISLLPTFFDSEINQIIIAAAVTLDCAYFDGMWGRCKYGYIDVRTAFDVINRLFVQTVSKVLSPLLSITRSGEEKNKKTAKIILGLCISVPFVVIIGSLLADSDAAFENLIKKLYSVPGDIIEAAIISVILFPFILSFAFSIRKNLDKATSPVKEYRIIDSTVLNTVLCMVCIVYMVYLFSQLSYFFNAFGGLLPENYSYAQYARRGFFELCVIASINLFIVFVSGAMAKMPEGKRNVLNKTFSLFICIFTLLIIATSESKIVMYINNYGMTINRIIPACFLVMLAICFSCAIIRIMKSDFPYIKILIVTGCLMIIAFTVADVDKGVAKYNIDRYLSGTLNDLTGIEYLGSSATSEILRLTQTDDKYAVFYANKVLNSRNDYYEYGNDNSNIGCFNLSQSKEEKSLKQYFKSIENTDYSAKEFYVEISANYECKEITVDYSIDGKVKGTMSCMHSDGSNLKAYEINRFAFEENQLKNTKDMDLTMDIYVTLSDGTRTLISEGDVEYCVGNEVISVVLTINEKDMLDYYVDRNSSSYGLQY